MKIYFKTKVNLPLEMVWRKFDENLFLALKPPLIPFKLIKFEGSKTGNRVELEVVGVKWVSLITQHEETKDYCYFIDEGEVLPWPLKKWHHRHLLEKIDNETFIIDEITYSTSNILLDYLLLPVLWPSFLVRKPIYRKYFNNLNFQV